MKVFVTGADGFIGRHVLKVLQSRGEYEIHAVTLDAMPANSQGILWHQADLLDVRQTDKIMRDVRPEFLMHFAWYVVPGQYWTSDKNMAWEKASIELVKRFYKNGGERLVAAGTCAEYAWGSDVLCEDETPLKPATLYGQCKLRVRTFLKEYCTEQGKSSAWGRIFSLYGPYEDARRLVPSVICSLLRNKPARCTHGNHIRDFLYVEDVASAFVSLLMSSVCGPVNIASGQPVTLQEVVLAAADRLDARERVSFGAQPAPENEPPRIVGDSRRLADEVGWHPEYDLATGMAQTVRYWQGRKSSLCEHN